MKKTFVYSVVLLLVMCVFAHRAAAQLTQIINRTECDIEVTIDCYDLCVHYNSAVYAMPPVSSVPPLYAPIISCPYKAGINDIVATVCYKSCPGVCVQVDCMPTPGPCGVGATTAVLPACPNCPNPVPVIVQYFPGTKELDIHY